VAEVLTRWRDRCAGFVDREKGAPVDHYRRIGIRMGVGHAQETP